MDRKSQIFKKTNSVGGVRRPTSKSATSAPVNKAFEKMLETIQKNLKPTILNNFSYKSGEKIMNFEKPTIKSITAHGTKHVAFLINGKPTIIDQQEAMKGFSENLEKNEELIN